MDWFEVLKQMKADSGLTTIEISEKANVPEPTLEKLFSGHTKNPKLSTVIAVTHSFGRTLDDLAPLIDIKKAPPPEDEDATLREREMLNGFRRLTAEQQDFILKALDAQGFESKK